MSTVEVLLVAVGLAMDAFAVSLAAAAGGWARTWRARFRLWFHFGLFQALMPIIGWYGGARLDRWVDAWDQWLAFALLVWIGVRMIRNGLRGPDESAESRQDPTRGRNLIGLSLATSLDALAVGFTFSFLDVVVWRPAIIIGLVAAAFSLAGCLLGDRLGARLGSRTEALGGVVLVLMGVRILLEQLGG